jgi:hypothetical protein
MIGQGAQPAYVTRPPEPAAGRRRVRQCGREPAKSIAALQGQGIQGQARAAAEAVQELVRLLWPSDSAGIVASEARRLLAGAAAVGPLAVLDHFEIKPVERPSYMPDLSHSAEACSSFACWFS